jgi:outer membrane cobalamin receptor
MLSLQRTVGLAVLLLLLGTANGMAQPDSTRHILSGFVTDAESGETLVGANLYVPSLQHGTTTNQHGFYSLSLPSDSVQLVVSFLGYEREVVPLRLTSDRRLDIPLAPSTVQAGSLEVTAERTPLQQTTRTSTVEITAARAKQTPTLLGETDVLKTLQLMPGVQSGNEGTSGLYVRGGTPDQNLVMLDGAPLYNVSHLFGFLSVFNPDIVQNVQLTKGGFPARYGGHLSSVVEVNVEDGNRKQYEAEGSLGLISSRLTVQGPIMDDKTSFLVSGRRTYADLLLRSVVDDLGAGYFFYDVNAKLNHRFSSTDQVFWSLYTGDDRFHSLGEIDDELSFDFGWGNVTSTLRWNHVYSSDLFGSLALRYSRYRFDINAENETDEDIFRLRYRSGIQDLELESSFDYTLNERHELRAGANVTYHRFRPGATEYRVSESDLDTTVAPSEEVHALNAAIYAEDQIEWSEQLSTNLGLRATTFAVDGTSYWSLQPRLSARYLLPSDWALKGSYSLMQQPIHLLSNSTIGLPTDLWVASTREVPPGRSHQVTLGLSRSFLNREYEVRLEGYGKLMDNLIEYKPGATYTLTATTDWESRVETGRGWSYGAELLLRRTRGRTSGWIGYTLSWTRRQFDALNDGEPFPFRYDRRHDFSATVSHQLTDVTSITGTWVYGTGDAVTAPSARYRGRQPAGERYNPTPYYLGQTQVQDYTERNGFRMPAYHRLDLGLRFKWGDRQGFHALKTGVYNAYNRKNPYFFQATEADEGGLKAEAVTLFPILPYVNYQFKF